MTRRSILRVLSLLQSKPYFRIHFFSIEKWKMMSTNWSFVWEKWKEGLSCEYYRYYKVSLTFEFTFFSRKVKNDECKLVRRVRKVKGRSFLQVLSLLQSKPYFRIHFFSLEKWKMMSTNWSVVWEKWKEGPSCEYYRYYKVSLTFEFTFFSRKVKNDEYKLVLRVRKVKGRSILRVLSLLQSKPYFRIHFFSLEKWKMMSANWSVVWEKWKEGHSCKYYRYYKVSLTFEFTFFL